MKKVCLKILSLPNYANYSRLMKASSQEASDNTGYAATRYPEVANNVHSEKQSITPQEAPHPLSCYLILGMLKIPKHSMEDISLSNVIRDFKIPLRESLIFSIFPKSDPISSCFGSDKGTLS